MSCFKCCSIDPMRRCIRSASTMTCSVTWVARSSSPSAVASTTIFSSRMPCAFRSRVDGPAAISFTPAASYRRSRQHSKIATKTKQPKCPRSFHQREHTRRTGVSTFDLEGRCYHYKPVFPNLGKIGDELNDRNAFLEQREVVCDPHFAWIEFDPSPDCLFRKDIHRHRGTFFFAMSSPTPGSR